MYNYAENDKKILAKAGRQRIQFYPEYFAKAQKAGYDSLFEYLEELYSKNQSTLKVGAILGVSSYAIRTWLKLVGCELKSKGGRTIKHEFEWADECLGKRVQYYPKYLTKARVAGYGSLIAYLKALRCERRKTIAEIAKIMDCSSSVAYKCLKLVKLV